MKKFMKRSLIVMVVILSMIAALCVAVSANTTIPTDTVASVTRNGQTKYYTDFAQLVYEANGSGDTNNNWSDSYEITLYADVEQNTAIVARDVVTVKAADGLATRPKLTIQISNPRGSTLYRGAYVLASAANGVVFKGIDIEVKENTLALDPTKGSTSLVMFNSANKDSALGTETAPHNHFVTFEDVNITSVAAVINEYNAGEYTNCNVTVKGGTITATGDFIEGVRSSRAGEFAFNLSVSDGATFTVANLYSAPTANNDSAERFITYCTDEAAKADGFGYRVGDTATGKGGVVFFETETDALAVAAAGVKVWNITGATPVEVVKACEHTYTDEVVAPTCDAEGYTKHTCSKCGVTFNDTTVAATGHNYSKATCTSKAKCSACNKETGELGRHKYSAATCTKKATCEYCAAERGELAAHVDANADDKCDKCEAKMSPEETTAAVEEKKGCGGTVTVAGLALVAALGSCAIFVEKKRK